MSNFAPDYVDVADRIRAFREKHPEGSFQPADKAVPYRIETIGSQTYIVYTAAAYRSPDDPTPGIGSAWEPVPGQTNFTKNSELQNAETSAWGRAIVAALAADAKKVASADEVRNRSAEQTIPHVPLGAPAPQDRVALKPQIDRAKKAAHDAGIENWVADQGFPNPWTVAVCEAVEDAARNVQTLPPCECPEAAGGVHAADCPERPFD